MTAKAIKIKWFVLQFGTNHFVHKNLTTFLPYFTIFTTVQKCTKCAILVILHKNILELLKTFVQKSKKKTFRMFFVHFDEKYCTKVVHIFCVYCTKPIIRQCDEKSFLYYDIIVHFAMCCHSNILALIESEC